MQWPDHFAYMFIRWLDCCDFMKLDRGWVSFGLSCKTVYYCEIETTYCFGNSSGVRACISAIARKHGLTS